MKINEISFFLTNPDSTKRANATAPKRQKKSQRCGVLDDRCNADGLSRAWISRNVIIKGGMSMTLDPRKHDGLCGFHGGLYTKERQQQWQYEFVWVPDSMHVDHVLQEDTAPKSILSEEDKEKEALPPPPPESSGSPISGFPGFSGSPL